MGMLDRFLGSDVVEGIAYSAAQKAEVQGKTADAITFYGLSCAWTKMATLLSRELSERLMPIAENRSFWKEIGTKVYEMLTNVLQSPGVDQARELAAEGVFMMLRLMDFFEILQGQGVPANRLGLALGELDRIGLLPSSPEEVNRMTERIRSRGADDGVRTVLPQVLETGMQCLRHYHIEVKRELHGSAPDIRDAHQWRASRERALEDVENKGRAMMALAGGLPDVLPASFVADLSRVQANIFS